MLGHPWNCTMDGIWKAVYLNFYRQKQPNFLKKTNSIVRNFFLSLHGLWFSIPHFQKKMERKKDVFNDPCTDKVIIGKSLFHFFSANGSDTFSSFNFFCTSCISFSWINMPEVASSMNWFTAIDKKCIFFLCASKYHLARSISTFFKGTKNCSDKTLAITFLCNNY